MRVRLLIVAASALMVPGSAMAEPAKLPQPRPAANPVPMILASADQVVAKSSLPAQVSDAPAKRPRAARATTCRCGGAPQPQSQEQP
jgi:hypothetical protein